MKQFISALLLLCVCHYSFAQNFLTPLEVLTGKATVTTVDGKTVTGKLTSYTFEARGLGNFKIKDSATNEVTKFEPENVKTLQVKTNLTSKLETAEKQSKKSVFGLLKSDNKEIVERDYITFNLIAYPEKKDKFLLLELLNPDFASKIQVYEHRVGTKSSTSIFGITTEADESRSYIIVINGVASFVEKKNYKKEYFDKIFASCPELMAMPEKEVSFKDFAKHVYIFDKKCK